MNFVNNPEQATIRRFVICLCVSFLLHIVILAKFGLFPKAGITARSSSPLQISLRASSETVSVRPAPQIASEPEILLPPEEPRMAMRNEVPRNSATVQSKTRKVLPEVVPEPAPVPRAYLTPTLQPAQDSGRQVQPSGIPLPGLTGQVKRVDIVFDVFTGSDRHSMGKVRHLYNSEDGYNYGVSIKPEFNTGEEPKMGERWKYEVSGRITGQGLSPIFFDVQGMGTEQLMALKEVPVITAGATKSARKGRTPDGIMDRQSLIYQFMIKPPELTGGQLWLSDGVTSGIYSYRFAGFDSLPITALGGVRAIKLVISIIDSAEAIELWLVPDMHYLPVKVRHTDRNGVVTEQEAVSLEFN